MASMIHKVLCNKKANATVYYCVVLMLMAFLVLTVCINIFRMYSMDVRIQLISDAISDGAAVYGQTPIGFDENRTIRAAEELFQINKLDGINLSYDITVDDEIINGSNTGDKIVTVTVTGQADHIFTDFINFLSDPNNPAPGTFQIKAKSVVKVDVMVEAGAALSQSYYEAGRHDLPLGDFITTTPGNRNASYITWLMEYYLSPEYNPIYQPDGVTNATKGGHLLLDYIKHMGLSAEPYSPESLVSGSGTAAYSSYSFDQNATAAQIQEVADAGEIMFITCRDSASSDPEVYIVVPAKSILETNEISVAYANKTTDNYKVIDWDEFKATHTSIHLYHHE